MALGRKMDHSVDLIVAHHSAHGVKIGHICFYKCVVGPRLHILEILQIAGIRQQIQIHYIIVRIFLYKESHHMGADEAGSPGDQYIAFAHFFILLMQTSRESTQ